jgi:hypothetical protein
VVALPLDASLAGGWGGGKGHGAGAGLVMLVTHAPSWRFRPRLMRWPGVAVVFPAGLGELLTGDDPGLRARGEVGAVTIPPGLGRLAGVPRLGVADRDHPVFGHLAGDPSPPIGAIRPVSGLHVLPGDQRQQPHRRGSLLAQLPVLQGSHQRVRVIYQGRHQRVLGGRVVPAGPRLARLGVIAAGCRQTRCRNVTLFSDLPAGLHDGAAVKQRSRIRSASAEPHLLPIRPSAMNITEKPLFGLFWLGRPGAAVRVPAGTLLLLTALVLSACTTSSASGRGTHPPSAADMALIRFNSCGDALRNLRTAATRAFRAGTLPASGGVAGSHQVAPGAPPAAPSAGGPAADSNARAEARTAQGSATSGSGQLGSGAAAGWYSGTNTATAGVDEPDLVKTDGRRIVTVSGMVLRVVDAQTRQLTGVLDLSSGTQYGGRLPATLLLAGNHALVLFSQSVDVMGGPAVSPGAPGSGAVTPPGPVGSPSSVSPGTVMPIQGPRLVLVDLSTGTPRIISDYTMDGSLVDARQIGPVARVVIQSAPRLYPLPYGPGGPSGAASYRTAITRARLSQWLPRYEVTAGAVTRTGLVDCSAVSHPAAVSYTGNSMLTVLTFDLSGPSLGNGDPVTIVADGDIVYSDGTSLYIASREWAIQPAMGTTGGGVSQARTAGVMPAASPGYTGIYKFDISGPGRPVYEASGSVPGWLLGSSGTAEYSLSAWNGALRVATTTYGSFTTGHGQGSRSAVYVLEQSGGQMVVVGRAGGLGAGEQIYAVRFVGPVGYVVTFRQTDPLYTLDLSDPARPRVVGQLPLNGYSAYLYPVDATHLIGVGQNTNALGQTTGTQISLFDVSDLAAPVRLATYDLQFGHSEAEFDPHAFLYWSATKLLVIPVQLPYGTAPQPMPEGGTVQDSPAYSPVSEAVALHVDDHGFTKLGTITHPVTVNDPAGAQIRRSLIIGSALWTLSDAGLKANDSTTLTPLAWVAFSPITQVTSTSMMTSSH